MKDRALDGHINRALEGKTVLAVTKDGTFMTIHCTNGERWCVGWADFIQGEGYAGEPVIVAVDSLRDVSDEVEVRDGGIHHALVGKTIESARTDGLTLIVACVGGRSYGLAWVDPATRQRVRGEPCLVKVDATIMLEGVSAFGVGAEM